MGVNGAPGRRQNMYSAPGGVIAHNTVRTALTLCNQQKWSTGRIQFDMLTVCQKKVLIS